MKNFILLAFALVFACGCRQTPVPGNMYEGERKAAPVGVTQTTGGENSAARLFDGDPQTVWFSGWNAGAYPARCVVDFGREIQPVRVRLYDGTGQPTLKIYGLDGPTDNGIYHNLAETQLDRYQQWQDITAFTNATPYRYFLLELAMPPGEIHQTAIGEVEFYTGTGTDPPLDTVVVAPACPCDTATTPPVITPWPGGERSAPRTPQHAIGINGRPYEHVEPVSFIKAVRLYISSGWVWKPAGLATDPMFQAETEYTHGIGDYLRRAKTLDQDVVLCVHQTPNWVGGGPPRGDNMNDYPPIKAGARRDDPNSYRDYAAFMWQLAARFGGTEHAAHLMRVDTTLRWPGDIANTVASGLGLLKFLEPWNEEKWWRFGTPDYIEPETMAALMSAVFDGHCGTMGAGVGIMAADPGMTVLMPGLTDFDLPYFYKMNAWFVANRADKRWPCHVLNFHHYSNTGNQLGKQPPTWVMNGGCVPAQDKNFPLFAEIVKQAKLLGLPVWITECGYDSRGPSQMAFPGTEAERGQAMVTTCQAYLAAGAQRVFLYVLADEPAYATGQLYQSSGLLTTRPDYQPKASVPILKKYITGLKGAATPAKARRQLQ